MRVCSCLSSPGPQHARVELAANAEEVDGLGMADSTEIPTSPQKFSWTANAPAWWDVKQTTARVPEVESGHGEGEGDGSARINTRRIAMLPPLSRGPWMDASQSNDSMHSARVPVRPLPTPAVPAVPCMYSVCRWHYDPMPICTWYLDGDLISSPVGKCTWTSLTRGVEQRKRTTSQLDAGLMDNLAI